jgi:hypothetical protein
MAEETDMRNAHQARLATVTLALAGVMVSLAGVATHTQAPAPAQQTATQFYMAYRAAFDKAKSIDELFPYLSSKNREEAEATPAADRAKMFEVIKMMGALTDVRVIKEARTADGATLTVEALDSEKKKATGTVEIVKEGGAWKVGKESWKS